MSHVANWGGNWFKANVLIDTARRLAEAPALLAEMQSAQPPDISTKDADIRDDLLTMEAWRMKLIVAEITGVNIIKDIHKAFNKNQSCDAIRMLYTTSNIRLRETFSRLDGIEDGIEEIRKRRPIYLDERMTPASIQYIRIMKYLPDIVNRIQYRLMVRFRFIESIVKRIDQTGKG